MDLSRIRIVLVNTSHPGNIGATARAMKNMGLSKLSLVAPSQFPHADATARASGADDVLARAEVHSTLEEAVAECGLVFGASARLRTIAWPQVEPRQCAALAVEGSADTEVALVFGREHAGLTNEELALCHYLVHIPANPDYSSLNVAASVQVLSYELRMTYLAMAEQEPAVAAPKSADLDEQPATGEDMQGLYHHLEQTLVDIDFLNPANPRQLMHRLRRLFNRSRPSKMEINILRGILTAAQKQARKD